MTWIVWYRGKDLRVADHAPLREAATRGPVLPVFVLEPRYFGTGGAARAPHRMQYLLDALGSLDAALRGLGTRLHLLDGPSTRAIPALVDRVAAEGVLAQRATTPTERARDARVGRALGERLELHDGETLLPPGTLRTGAGKPFSVYSQFARAFHRDARLSRPQPAPKRVEAAAVEPPTGALPTLSSLGLEPNPGLIEGGEAAAQARLSRFTEGALGRYADARDRMDLDGTSRLSADLKFGTLSVRSAWWAAVDQGGDTEGARRFLAELLWREFAYSTLWDRPTLLRAPFRPEFSRFPWLDGDGPAYRAWTEGRTGYPIVDAAARQLLAEGYVHNRARMIAASFLTKHLLVHYRHGEAHYMRHLVDGDPPQNNAGWQWSAGCGCDAQPYFRVFNPVLQGRRFDPDGAYVKRYVPELSGLPAKYVHAPWEAPPVELAGAGVRLGEHYPEPIVEHRMARERFLALAAEHVKRRAA